ncbi:contractile injection system tape measure protein [Flavobacterium humi]|uniref:Uncharacterized protein n=1 Tax=Flavobacterium humi TaxID=2562683 RepID=A0A4Z0L8K5_9FLAO|nr:contractile injection system tape measure protein [Flavobacterium humi]TGD57505.1 hypothetical protein E4635_09940 [Flavobacterium humi]
MHLLQQHTFDIQCSSQAFGKEIQRQLADLLEKEFYPKLDDLLDQYTHPNHIWSIDVLELQLPKIFKENWKTELVQKSLQQIEAYLKDNNPVIRALHNDAEMASGAFLPKGEHAGFLFFHFLKTGVLLENTLSKDLNVLTAAIEITPVFLKKLLEFFEADFTCIARWIFSVPVLFKAKITAQLAGFPLTAVFRVAMDEKIPTISPLRKRMQGDKILEVQWIELVQWTEYLYRKRSSGEVFYKEFLKLSERYWQVSAAESVLFFKEMAQIITENKGDSEMALFFKAFVQSATDENHASAFRKAPGFEPVKELQPLELQYISNAGLVLLHPFLKTLFEQLGLCENEIWKTEMHQHKAILLTQYLITGEEKIQENELLLNKVLCGLALEDTVNVQLKIKKKEKEKCHSLLEAVLEHWTVMSGSSKEALQQTFLQREGKLDIQMGNTYELWVEEKGFDVLLAQLPWGIGMVKTPWMENYLTCHWN